MNNNVYKGDVQPNHKEYSVWVDSKGVIKTFDGNEWKVASGGCISTNKDFNNDFNLDFN